MARARNRAIVGLTCASCGRRARRNRTASRAMARRVRSLSQRGSFIHLVSAVTNLPIRRNTILLASAVAVNSATLQLVSAVSAITFALVTGATSLLGLGPALFLVSSAL